MKQTGTILLEVLISIVVLAFGILGLASLQAYSLRASQSSNLRSIASDLATSMAEQIQTNRPKQIASTEAGQSAKYYNTNTNVPVPPDYAQIKCTYDSETSNYSCAKPSGYTPDSKTATISQTLAENEVINWLNLIKASLPLGTNQSGNPQGGGIICKDTSPDDGTEPNYDPADGDFSANTGCLSSTDTTYAAAPYVIKIWYEEQVSKIRYEEQAPKLEQDGANSADDNAKDKQVRILRRFSTTLL